MNKKILLSIVGTVLTVGILVAVDANKSVNFLSSNGFVIENALALAVECEDGKVIGSPMDGKCNQPMSTDGKKKCPTSIITCQGDASCCERKKCSLHSN
jgi:hypothetical protein